MQSFSESHTTPTIRAALWDRLGGWASSACAVHCLLTPLLILTLPAFAKVWAHPASHALMATLVIPLALTVVVHGYRTHRRQWVLAAALTGVALVLAGSALPFLANDSRSSAQAGAEATCNDCCPTIVADPEGVLHLRWPPATIVTIIGSAFLVAAHWGNRRGCAC